MKTGRRFEGKEVDPTNSLPSGRRPVSTATDRAFDDLQRRIEPRRSSTDKDAVTPSPDGPYRAVRTHYLDYLERQIAYAEDDLRLAEIRLQDAKLRLRETVEQFP